METRDAEKFKVQFANTARLQNSSIIYMQKLLNENEEKTKLYENTQNQIILFGEFLCMQSCDLTVILFVHYIAL